MQGKMEKLSHELTFQNMRNCKITGVIKMQDYIVRATAADAQIRAFAATTKNLVEFARSAHATSPVATAALGRLLSAGAMMGTMLKGEDDLLTLQIKGDGLLHGITVTADSRARVKGYTDNPQVMLPPNERHKLDVGGAIGNGMLTVIRDLGLKEPYVGQTALQTGEIAEDLTYYFATSEQIPSSVGLGVLMEKDNTVKQAGGFIIQLMPFAQEDVIERLEKNLAGVSSVTSLLDAGNKPEQMLQILLDGLEPEINETIPTEFYCNCEKKRIEKAIISIGEKDIREMIADGEPIEVKCHFCNTAYQFSIDELKELLKKAKR
jgi:molecular chaperone Hsp33